MEKRVEKCSFIDHNQVDACSFCQECKVYMCNKCSNYHNGLFKDHHQYILNQDFNNLFIGLCKEENHYLKLEYYCKNHDILCCDSCIVKLKAKGKGQHKDCDICFVEDIKDEKKNKLEKNIKSLEDLYKNLDNSIKELKEVFEKISESKEQLKSNIQKEFTKIRNAINEREDELLIEVDNQYNNIFCKEDIIKEGEKLPDKIKLSIEKGKAINNEWNDNKKLVQLIYDCINIEDNIKKINLINENIKKCNLNKEEIIEFSSNKKIDDFINEIKTFGQVSKQLDIDTVILKNKDDLIKFNNLMSNCLKIDNIKLLYRATRDGDTTNSFHKKCNNIKGTLMIVKTSKNFIFGGYTNEIWNEDKSYRKDDNAFCFSLNLNKIYKSKKTNYSINCNNSNNYGFGNYFFSINNNCLSKGGMMNDGLNVSYDNQKMENEINNGETNYQIVEVEVFEI